MLVCPLSLSLSISKSPFACLLCVSQFLSRVVLIHERVKQQFISTCASALLTPARASATTRRVRVCHTGGLIRDRYPPRCSICRSNFAICKRAKISTPKSQKMGAHTTLMLALMCSTTVLDNISLACKTDPTG